jgi:short-subunit dehydrogenase
LASPAPGQLAEEGCHLHLASRTKADLERAKESIQARHNVSVTIHRRRSQQRRCRAVARGGLFRHRHLVNNAGAIPAGDLQAIDERGGATPGISRCSATSTCAARSIRR